MSDHQEENLDAQSAEEGVVATPADAATDWEAKYLRALADYQNLVKQTAKEKEDFYQYALSSFLYDFLPIYDNLKMSVANLPESEKQNAWVEGVGYVLKQCKEMLVNKKVEEIVTVGQKFDPETMEAVDGSGDIVAQEVKPGYKFNGQVIVPAKVIVKSE